MQRPKIESPRPKPFIKWAGGKRQLMDVLLENLPAEYNRYIEPFVGGGALFFKLLPERAIISDINSEISNACSVIKDNVDALVRSLKKHKNTSEYFYGIRAKNPGKLTPVQKASRFIYLNRTCFNGLYRENSKGQFNVPFGRYKSPKIADEENLTVLSEYLRANQIEILNQDYKQTALMAEADDFVYLDPPYHPMDSTTSFTKYHKRDFTEKDQVELSKVFMALDCKGCYVMLSNSKSKLIKQLYPGYNIQTVKANRAINCKGDKRGKRLYEVIVKNY